MTQQSAPAMRLERFPNTGKLVQLSKSAVLSTQATKAYLPVCRRNAVLPRPSVIWIYPPLLLFHLGFQTIQRCAPESLVVRKPVADQRQRFGVEAAVTGRALPARADQAGGVQEANMFGYGGPAHAEVPGNAAHCLLTAAENAEDFPAGRVGDGTEYGVALTLRFGNHSVTNKVAAGCPVVKVDANRPGTSFTIAPIWQQPACATSCIPCSRGLTSNSGRRSRVSGVRRLSAPLL